MTQENIVKGSLYALAGFFCMALFGILTKQALIGGSAVWVSFIAYLTGTCLLMPYIVSQGIGYLKSNHLNLLLGRALFGTVASFLYTVSIYYIPIVNGTLLFNTAPIFIPLLSLLFLHAKIEKKIWIAVIIGFVGIIVIMRPTEAIFMQTGNLIAIFSGISLAVAYLMMKLLTSSDPGVRIIFYYLGIGTLLQIPCLIFFGSVPPIDSILYAIVSGLVLVAAQLFLVTGYRYAEASQIGIYQYTSIVFVGLLDWLFWGATPNSMEIMGILLVAAAGVIIIRSGNKKSN